MPLATTMMLRSFKPLSVPLRERVAKAVFVPGADLRTDDVIPLEELNLAGPGRMRYKPTGWSVLPRILPVREVAGDDVFIDYGSGMGRIVYEAAARYPFRRVIGLELSSELNQIARSNLDRNAHLLRCSNVDLVTADALEYEPPPDVTVAFFANPFNGPTFELAVEKLLQVASRPLRIIYANPVEHGVLMATGRVRVTRRLRGWRPGSEWSRSNSVVMYEFVPGA
jgi:hypothetical protein